MNIINAYARGYLARRLMRTERVITLKKIYKEALHCMLKLHVDAPLNLAEVNFLHRLQLQVIIATSLLCQFPGKLRISPPLRPRFSVYDNFNVPWTINPNYFDIRANLNVSILITVKCSSLVRRGIAELGGAVRPVSREKNEGNSAGSRDQAISNGPPDFDPLILVRHAKDPG